MAALQILLDRGFDPNAAPFGVSPLLLAALAGTLHAAQFLYVRGADMHQGGGVSHQQLLPIDGALACGFLRPEPRKPASKARLRDVMFLELYDANNSTSLRYTVYNYHIMI